MTKNKISDKPIPKKIPPQGNYIGKEKTPLIPKKIVPNPSKPKK